MRASAGVREQARAGRASVVTRAAARGAGGLGGGPVTRRGGGGSERGVVVVIERGGAEADATTARALREQGSGEAHARGDGNGRRLERGGQRSEGRPLHRDDPHAGLVPAGGARAARGAGAGVLAVRVHG